MRYCTIDAGNRITNIIEWDGETNYDPGEGLTLRPWEEGDAIFALVVIPQAITPRQARLALNAAAMRDIVESAVAASGRDAQDYWEYALTIERDNALLNTLALGVGITPEQLDQLFIAGAAL